jgi:flagellar assembly protein FliH
MASPARYTFDLNLAATIDEAEPEQEFTPVVAPPPEPTVPESLVAEMVAQARQDGYADGLVAGGQNASAMAAQTVAAAAATLATQTLSLMAERDAAQLQAKTEAITLAASIGRKLALHLLARYPTVELEALIAECMQSLNNVPHLVVRCHPDIADAIRDIATEHMQTSGFAGRLVVLGDPEQRFGDGRLEWVDGGLVRDIAEISKEIDVKISAYLNARKGRAPTQESEQ